MDISKIKNLESDFQTFDHIVEAIEFKHDEGSIDWDCILDLNDLYEALDYDGSIHEAIESCIDIYYYNIRKWAVDNWNYVEEAIDCGLCEGVSDYHKIIQSGQYVFFSEDSREAVREIFEALQA